jgi:hypothetical protein
MVEAQLGIDFSKPPSVVEGKVEKIQVEQQHNRAHYPDGFFRWLADNYGIFCEFEKRALEVRSAGRKHFSARIIIENIRWHTLLRDKDATFKINNNWVPGLARLVMRIHPELDGMFELRNQD